MKIPIGADVAATVNFVTCLGQLMTQLCGSHLKQSADVFLKIATRSSLDSKVVGDAHKASVVICAMIVAGPGLQMTPPNGPPTYPCAAVPMEWNSTSEL